MDNQSHPSHQPVATPPDSPTVSSRGSFHDLGSPTGLGVISEEGDIFGRQRSATLPSKSLVLYTPMYIMYSVIIVCAIINFYHVGTL